MKSIIYIASGKCQNLVALAQHFNQLSDGKYLLETKHADRRSIQQNRYYWDMCDIIKDALRDAGWNWIRTKEDAHNYLREKFLRITEVNEETGEGFDRTRSTTELTPDEMNAYWEDIWQFASEYLGIYIPPPEKIKVFFNSKSQ
jgi:hypothetical protein